MNRRLMNLTIVTSFVAFTVLSCADGSGDRLEETDSVVGEPVDKPSIVLVHGAWADALGWQKVIPALQEHGYRVVAVENPLTSLADDIATTKRVLEAAAQAGPVVVVAHSLGGAAMTGAATGVANVKALVYVNAFAPDEGEAIGELAAKYPAPLGDALVPDAAGFLFIDPDKFRDVFCADVPAGDASVMASAQKPVIGTEFAELMTAPAWRDVPSFYLVGTQDRAIPPEGQRFMAERMGATTVEIASSHASMVSHPADLVRFIRQAVTATH